MSASKKQDGGRQDPTIGKSFSTGNKAEIIFSDWLPPDWLCRKRTPDVFIDYVVEIVENGEPTGLFFAAQIKGVFLDKNRPLPKKYPASGKHVRYWLKDYPHPVFLFLIDVETRRGVWVFVQKFAKESISTHALENQKTITLQLDPADAFADMPRFLSALKLAQVFVRNLHPGSPAAAIQKRRQELQRQDPRLSFSITATDTLEQIHVFANEQFELQLRVPKSAKDAFKHAVENGKECKLLLKDVEFGGSPFFESYNNANGHLVFHFGEKKEGHIALRYQNSQGQQHIQVDGEYSTGTKRATFRGGLKNAPMEIEGAIEPSASISDTDISIEFYHHLRRWVGQPILVLPHFDDILGAYEALIGGAGLEIELHVQGNRFATGKLWGTPSERNNAFLETLRWISRCRTVAVHYGINPKLPSFDSISEEQRETVNDLAALMHSAKRVMPFPHFGGRCATSGAPDSDVKPPFIGCWRLDKENAVLEVLGQPVEVGNIRLIFTNVTITKLKATRFGKRLLDFKGSDSTLRIVEKY